MIPIGYRGFPRFYRAFFRQLPRAMPQPVANPFRVIEHHVQRRNQKQDKQGCSHKTEADGDGHGNEKLRLKTFLQQNRQQTGYGREARQYNGAKARLAVWRA